MESEVRRMKRHRTIRSIALGSLLLGLTQCNSLTGMSQGDLVKSPLCVIERCNATTCMIEVLAGKILDDANQNKGDCVTAVCNETGQIAVIPNLEDLPLDNNPCTRDECQGPFPVHVQQEWGRCYTGPPGTEGVGKCRAGAIKCGEGFDCIGEVLPTEEVCDLLHVDDDCDGQVDEEDGPGCYCGDGFAQPDAGEACDDGNNIEDDACKSNCTAAECGDGVVQRAAGENCDDGNVVNGDECPADCRIPIVALTTGDAHTCAAYANQVVKCWGENLGGQLGIGNRLSKGLLPQQMGQYLPAVDIGMPGIPILDLAAGSSHTCALFEGGTIKCWGGNNAGQLGLGDLENRGDDPGEMGIALPAVDLGTDAVVKAISAGYAHTCALLTDGRVKCWGSILGLGDNIIHGATPGTMGNNLPAVDLGATPLAISAGYWYNCALFEEGKVKCWGNNDHGQLGLGDTKDRGMDPSQMGANLPFVKLGIGKRAIDIRAAGQHTCALLEGGSVKCWGLNLGGMLGMPSSDFDSAIGNDPTEMGDALQKVDLGPEATVIALEGSVGNTCATLSDQSIKCWGVNQYGSLGLGDAAHRGDKLEEMGENLPALELGTGAQVHSLRLGPSFTCAWLVGERIKCWGRGELLGLGDTETRGDFPGEMGDALPFVEPL